MTAAHLQQYRQECQQSGHFGPIRLGMTREQVKGLSGEPEATGGTSRKQRVPLIWRYGDVEFHFRTDGGLGLIYSEDEDSIVSLVVTDAPVDASG